MDDSDFAKYFPASFGKPAKTPTPKPKQDKPADDLEAFRSMMPTSFGKKSSIFSKSQPSSLPAPTGSSFSPAKAASSSGVAQESTPEATEKHKADNSQNAELNGSDKEDNESEDEGNDTETQDYSGRLPVSHEIVLNEHHKTISAMSLDSAGGRLVTGGYDFSLNFWDFTGMDSRLRPFRSVEPCGSHQIHDVKHSISGDRILIISGEAKARIYDRNGMELVEYQKGDPYIRDMKQTSGHVAALTSGDWHPQDKKRFVTASADGTVRLWDVENKRKQVDLIAYKTKDRGGRTAVTAVTYSPDGNIIAAAAADGSISYYPANGPFLRSIATKEGAHQHGTETSSIVISQDNQTLVTRGGDDTVKLWDMRNFTKPLSVAEDLSILNAESNVIFSPDERLILTGTGVRKGDGYGKVVMLDRNDLSIVRTLSVSQSSVVRVLWPESINQIITGSADGTAHVYYDPEVSKKGALLCVSKAPKKRAVDDYEIDRPILTPHALPMYKEEQIRSNKRKQEKMRSDPAASHRPEMPFKGPGRGGNVGVSLTQHILTDITKDTTREEDPRAALLKYADKTDSDPMWITPAYKKNQPKPVFSEEADPHAQREMKRKK